MDYKRATHNNNMLKAFRTNYGGWDKDTHIRMFLNMFVATTQ